MPLGINSNLCVQANGRCFENYSVEIYVKMILNSYRLTDNTCPLTNDNQ